MFRTTDYSHVFILLVVVGLTILSIWAVARVVQSDGLKTSAKFSNLVLALLVPLIGPIIVFKKLGLRKNR